jgi:hypothetical protein
MIAAAPRAIAAASLSDTCALAGAEKITATPRIVAIIELTYFILDSFVIDSGLFIAYHTAGCQAYNKPLIYQRC